MFGMFNFCHESAVYDAALPAVHYCNRKKNFVPVKISYSSVRELLYAINFSTVRAVSHSLGYMHGFRILLKFRTFVLSVKVRNMRNQIVYEIFCDYSIL